MALVGGRMRRKYATLALLTLLVVVLCACLVDETSAYKRGAVPAHDNDDDDDDDDDEEDAFDFMSTNLAPPRRGAPDEYTCDAAASGACVAPATAAVASVVARGLVTTRPRVKDILREHARAASDVSSSSRFRGDVLGYVTPWNARGYDYARQFAAKFAFLAPVWLQLREDGKTKAPLLTGTHDIDRAWLADVRKGGAKIVPRVVYERNRLAEHEVPVIIDLLVTLAKREAFDGFVLEIPITPGTMDILLRTGRAFQDEGLLLLLVLTRSSNQGRLPVTPEMLDQLRPLVHRFTMNAYDYQTPGPNAPFEWIRATIDSFRDEDRAKILMGLPFYGYDNNDAIVGATYIEQLQQHDDIKIRWDAAAHECVHQYSSDRDGVRHTVYFPCLQFLQDRLQLFHDAGLAGAAVWELGQGLEYFYDLL